MLSKLILLKSPLGIVMFCIYLVGIFFSIQVVYKDKQLFVDPITTQSDTILSSVRVGETLPGKNNERDYMDTKVSFTAEDGRQYTCFSSLPPSLKKQIDANGGVASVTYQKNNPKNCVIQNNRRPAEVAKWVVVLLLFLIIVGFPVNLKEYYV